MSRLQKLRGLKLSYNGVGDKGLASLSVLVGLEQLCLDNSGSPTITQIGAGHLDKLRSLRVLDLSINTSHKDNNMIADEGTRIISKLTSLSSLFLGNKYIHNTVNNMIGTDGMANLCRLPNLSKLRLSKYHLRKTSITLGTKEHR